MILKLISKSNPMNIFSESLFHFFEHIGVILVFLFEGFFLLFGSEVNIFRANVNKGLSVIFAECAKGKFIDIIGEIEYFIALILNRIHLRKHIYFVGCFACCVINVLLAVLHTGYIFL